MKMNYVVSLKHFILITVFSVMGLAVSAQEESGPTYEEAKKEIKETFGTFPSFFKAFPKYALPGAWQAFKEVQSPNGSIDAKHRELIQLAVAAQIPCVYCVYFHTVSAQAFGATEEELKEAVAYGAQTRHWSMILQGAQVDFEEFKTEFHGMMKHMAEQAQ